MFLHMVKVCNSVQMFLRNTQANQSNPRDIALLLLSFLITSLRIAQYANIYLEIMSEEDPNTPNVPKLVDPLKADSEPNSSTPADPAPIESTPVDSARSDSTLADPPPSNPPQDDASPAIHGSVSLIISNTPVPDSANWQHVVVALSPMKQEQIMQGIGRTHSEESRLSTWSVVGNALSTALLSTSAGLYVQSRMKLHRKDFLLFTRTRTNAAREDGSGGILEIDFSNKLQGSTWQGHWQHARPSITHFVKQCESRREPILMFTLY